VCVCVYGLKNPWIIWCARDEIKRQTVEIKNQNKLSLNSSNAPIADGMNINNNWKRLTLKTNTRRIKNYPNPRDARSVHVWKENQKTTYRFQWRDGFPAAGAEPFDNLWNNYIKFPVCKAQSLRLINISNECFIKQAEKFLVCLSLFSRW